jgi:uncharacterized secreted protein with C-terminal beta-propeller domain
MKRWPCPGKRKISLRLRLELLEDRQLLAGGVVAASFGAAASIPLVSVVGSQQPAEQETVSAPARFGSEADLRQYLIDQAVNQWKYYLGAHFPNNGWWFYGGGGIAFPLAFNTVASGEATNFIGNSDPSPPLNSGFSQTNVQVSGVDEADQVKTDGQYIYLLADQKLEILRALPATDLAVVSHAWIEGQALGLFLIDDRVAVISNVYDYQKYGRSDVKVTLFDVSDATSPKVVQETYLAGWYVTSRAIGYKVYVVLQSSFNVPAPQFQIIDNERVYETEAAYRARLAAMPLEAILPEIYSRSQPFGPLEEGGPLVDPSNLYRPISSDANNLLSVAAFDVTGSNPGPIDKVSVLSPQATTVYASEDSFYVISAPWCSDPNSVVSTIEKISLAGNKLDLTATGEVPGLILNQYSVDESNGYLRIATNVGHGITSKANLYILADEGGTLTIVGRLENLVPAE